MLPRKAHHRLDIGHGRRSDAESDLRGAAELQPLDGQGQRIIGVRNGGVVAVEHQMRQSRRNGDRMLAVPGE